MANDKTEPGAGSSDSGSSTEGKSKFGEGIFGADFGKPEGSRTGYFGMDELLKSAQKKQDSSTGDNSTHEFRRPARPSDEDILAKAANTTRSDMFRTPFAPMVTPIEALRAMDVCRMEAVGEMAASGFKELPLHEKLGVIINLSKKSLGAAELRYLASRFAAEAVKADEKERKNKAFDRIKSLLLNVGSEDLLGSILSGLAGLDLRKAKEDNIVGDKFKDFNPHEQMLICSQWQEIYPKVDILKIFHAFTEINPNVGASKNTLLYGISSFHQDRFESIINSERPNRMEPLTDEVLTSVIAPKYPDMSLDELRKYVGTMFGNPEAETPNSAQN